MEPYIAIALIFLNSIGIVTPTDLPVVSWASPDEIKIIANSKFAPSGLCFDNHVYIRNDIDLETPVGMGVLVHELVHAIKQNGCPNPSTMAEYCRNENEAYAIHQQYLKFRGSFTILFNPCRPREM